MKVSYVIDSNLSDWVNLYIQNPVHVDCATTVMLKILDGKCKMNPQEKHVMAALYRACCQMPGKLLSPDLHALIAQAQAADDDGWRLRVYEQRLLAETTLSRPVMKSFKAMIRQQGLFELPLSALAGEPDAVHSGDRDDHAAA